MIKEKAIDLLELLEKRQNKYYDMNRQLTKLQGDFPTHVQCIDSKIETKLVDLLDFILEGGEFDYKGYAMASYYLYGLPEGGGSIRENDGKEYPIRNIQDVKDYVFRKNKS